MDVTPLQDFQRLHQVEQLARACCALRVEGSATELRLPEWIRRYAAAAWQDRFFAESNFRPLQQACHALLRHLINQSL